jgi:nucleotide sugar dehydrogenase
MKIGVIGAGRLGICFALLCEKAGYEVLVSDIRSDYVADLNNKKIKTNEPEVEYLLGQSKNLKATNDNREVIRECGLIYTLVPTPSCEDGAYDVTAVDRVVDDIVEEMKIANDIKNFVVGCTVNPGDCDKFAEKLPDSVNIFYNPEFIAQGSIVNDLQNADMVLLGHSHSKDLDSVIKDIQTLYKKIQTTRAIVCSMSLKAAEITKIAVNCFLTTKISYANMLGDVLHRAGCGSEVTTVLGAIGTDERIGRKYLNWGVGYGGPCLPRDNRAFGSFLEKLGGFHPRHNLGYVTDGINGDHGRFLVEYWEEMNTSNTPFYFDYISYKKGTDILTESQQFRLCTDLLEKGHRVYIHDDKQVTNQVYDQMVYQYGDRVRFVDNKDNITEPIFVVNL